jgi:hypothetical protein
MRLLPVRRLPGDIGSFLETLRHAPAFRHARLDIRSGKSPVRLVIGIGQVHGVGHGRFERFQARRIAAVQTWIFNACQWCTDQNILAFGQEGFSKTGDEPFYARLPAGVLLTLKLEIESAGSVPVFLRKTAKRWRKALKYRDADGIAEALTRLNALSLLQALDERVTVFPIEQQQIHGPLAAQLQGLHVQIERIEHSDPYRSVVAKKGKGLTRQEYDAAMVRQRLVKTYNGILTNTQRNEALFEEAMRYGERQELTVFVLGQGHRRAMLRLAAQYLPPDAAFVWITPSPLWRPVLVRRAVIIVVILLFTAYALLG